MVYACLLGTLVVTRRALKLSFAKPDLSALRGRRKKQLQLFSLFPFLFSLHKPIGA